MLDPNAARPVLLFLHIERSAGTAVHRFLAAHLRGYYVARPWIPIFSNEPEFGMRTAEFRALLKTPGLHGLGGHTLRPWLAASLPYHPSWMTILRFPLDRYLSHFQYQREAARCAWSLEDFARDRRTWDWQVVRLAGYRSIGEAWQRLQTFDAVGFDEGLERFMDALILHYGLPIVTPLGRTNAVRARVKWADLGRREKTLVEAANARDLELWQRARAQWREWHLAETAFNLFRTVRRTRARRLVQVKQRIWSTLVEIPAHIRYGDSPDPARFPLVARRSSDLWADESAPGNQ